MQLVDVLKRNNLATSAAGARRLVDGGFVMRAGETMTSINADVSPGDVIRVHEGGYAWVMPDGMLTTNAAEFARAISAQPRDFLETYLGIERTAAFARQESQRTRNTD
jgi:ribosomal protein S4